MRLKLERFGLPNKPSETPEQLEEPVRCGDWGRGLPFPLPLIRRQPLSPARRRTAPLTQGSHKAAAAANGEETGERCADGKKPTGKAQRNGRAVRGSEAAKRLEHERFRGDSAVRCRS